MVPGAHGLAQAHALRPNHWLPISKCQHSKPVSKCRAVLQAAGLPHISPHPQIPQRRRVAVRAGDDKTLTRVARLSNKSVLDEAARRFQKGLEDGFEEDFLIALELGADNVNSLSEIALQYKDKVKERLVKRASEIKVEDEARRNMLSSNFGLGKEAYGCGEYTAAVTLLEKAVEELGTNSMIGGEAQMWLALAYQACGREQECINLYKFIEANHPLPKTRKQAGELRYIMEAPKLPIGADERVTIPLITTDTWRAKDRKTSIGSRLTPQPVKAKKSNYWDRAGDMVAMDFVPDKWYVRVAWAALLLGLTVYGWWQSNGAGAS